MWIIRLPDFPEPRNQREYFHSNFFSSIIFKTFCLIRFTLKCCQLVDFGFSSRRVFEKCPTALVVDHRQFFKAFPRPKTVSFHGVFFSFGKNKHPSSFFSPFPFYIVASLQSQEREQKSPLRDVNVGAVTKTGLRAQLREWIRKTFFSEAVWRRPRLQR